ncbi:MAG TPA: DUF3592 domain-containing protein, partial [Solirubrobacteraceae bacterium]
MAKVGVHCYGCPAVAQVDESHPKQGLSVARWSMRSGETFCSACARDRSLDDPWEQGWAESRNPTDSGEQLDASAQSPPPGPAIADPATGAFLARYRRNAVLLLSVACVALAVTLGVLGIDSMRAKRLLVTGARTPGFVLSSFNGRTGGRMVVEYVANGTVHRGTIHYLAREEYAPGEQIQVIYDRADPSRIRTPTITNEGGSLYSAARWALFVAVGLLIGSVGLIVRWLRWRRLLAEPWHPYQSNYVQGRRMVVPGRVLRTYGAGLELVPLDRPSAPPTTVMLTPDLLTRPTVGLAGRRIVWVVGSLHSRLLVGLPETGALFGARPPRGWPSHQWLAAQKPASRRERIAVYIYVGLGVCGLGVGALAAVGRHAWL